MIDNVFEDIMTKNFPNMVKEKDKQAQEVQSPKQEGPKTPKLRHIRVKMAKLKDKKRILKAAREKQLVPIRLSSDFSSEIFPARRDRHGIIKVMKSEDLQQPRLLYPARLSSKTEGEIKSFLENKKLKE